MAVGGRFADRDGLGYRRSCAPSSSVTRSLTVKVPLSAKVLRRGRAGAVVEGAVVVEVPGVGGDRAVGVGGRGGEGDRFLGQRRGGQLAEVGRRRPVGDVHALGGGRSRRCCRSPARGPCTGPSLAYVRCAVAVCRRRTCRRRRGPRRRRRSCRRGRGVAVNVIACPVAGPWTARRRDVDRRRPVGDRHRLLRTFCRAVVVGHPQPDGVACRRRRRSSSPWRSCRRRTGRRCRGPRRRRRSCRRGPSRWT